MGDVSTGVPAQHRRIVRTLVPVSSGDYWTYPAIVIRDSDRSPSRTLAAMLRANGKAHEGSSRPCARPRLKTADVVHRL